MDNKEKEYLGKLKVGYAIVKLQGRWFSPFFVKFSLIDIRKRIVTDKMIRRKMRSYSGYSREWYGENKELSHIQDIPTQGKLNEEEKDYLIDILKNPFSGVVERNERLAISARRSNNLKELLITKGLIERKEISTGGGRIVLVQLTKKGSHVLEKLGYSTENRIRQYGLVHEFWRDKVRRYYEKLGYKVTSEEKLNGERAHLVAEKGTERIAIEIESGGSDGVENIKKDLVAGFDTSISIPANEEVEGRIKKGLEKEHLNEIERVFVINSRRFG